MPDPMLQVRRRIKECGAESFPATVPRRPAEEDRRAQRQESDRYLGRLANMALNSSRCASVMRSSGGRCGATRSNVAMAMSQSSA